MANMRSHNDSLTPVPTVIDLFLSVGNIANKAIISETDRQYVDMRLEYVSPK